MCVYSWMSSDLVFPLRSSGCVLSRQPWPMKACSVAHHASGGFRRSAEESEDDISALKWGKPRYQSAFQVEGIFR